MKYLSATPFAILGENTKKAQEAYRDGWVRIFTPAPAPMKEKK